MPLIELRNYIGGKLLPPASDQWLDGVNPATGERLARIPDSDSADVDQAVTAAQAAFPDWSSLSLPERAAWLYKIADGIEGQLDKLAEAETHDNGKPYKLARSVDIPRAVANFRFFASIIQGFESQSHASPDGINYTLRDPLGPVACISPWNLPLYLFTWKVAPALAAGNCVVGKPSEVTPLTAFLLAEICCEIGLPDGVFNVLHGSGERTGNALIIHPQIQAVSFTGGTRTGAHIARQVAPLFKKLSLELGGKNPNIIFTDCDYDRALETTIRSSYTNQGQICLCGSRVYVQADIYERFKQDLVAKSKTLRVGDPLDDANDLGAVVSYTHQQKILRCIERAQQEGGTILCGGNALQPAGRCQNGYFVAPTVIEGLTDDCETNREEIFGPVATIQPFESDEEAIARANSNPYGLSATIWTSNLQRAHRVARRLDVGVVWVNSWLVRDLRTPFGGMKNSGSGREGGLESLRFFTEPKNIYVAY